MIGSPHTMPNAAPKSKYRVALASIGRRYDEGATRARFTTGNARNMPSSITVPSWLALVVAALALLALLEHFFLPALRALMRRRFNRAIEDLNTRLRLRIQPFKLAKRQALIDQLIFDPDVLRAIEDYAA